MRQVQGIMGVGSGGGVDNRFLLDQTLSVCSERLNHIEPTNNAQPCHFRLNSFVTNSYCA